MEIVTLIASLIVAISWHSASANLKVTPADTEAKVGDSTYFNCSTDILSKQIHWSHGTSYVYAGGVFYEPYSGRFTIEINNSTGEYNLVIPSVGAQDVGEYFCQDDGGHGKQSPAAKLIVLADEPTCHSDSIQDGNYCGIHPYEVQLSCSVTYYGNTPPQLEWLKAGENSALTGTTSVKSGNNITYSLTLKTDLSMNNQSYVCQTTQSVTNQSKCNSETFRLQYVFSDNSSVNITMDQEITCSANTSQSCSYKWIWFSESDSVTVSNNQTLKPSRAGSHRCEATCPIGTKSCMVNAMFVKVSPGASAKKLLLLLLILPAILIIILIIFKLCRRPKRANKGSHIHIGESEPIKPDDSMAPLVADNNEQVKPRDAEPNKDPEAKVVTYNSKQSTPFLASKVESKEPVKQNFAEPDQDLNEKVGAIETDQSKLPSTALKPENKEEVKQNQTEPNKDTKGLGLLSGRPVRVKDIKIQFKEKRIAGVTALKNNIFIALGNSPVLEVYDAAKMCEFIREKSIPKMVNPFDLTSCQKIDCVFISDFKFGSGPKEIIRIDSSLVVDKRWSTGDDFGNLSVSSECNVIMCVSNKNKLIEYTKDGEMLREINTPGKTHPCHAIKLNDGHFVISLGCKGDPLHQVCNVTMNGDVLKLVKSFGVEMGSSLKHLNEPNYLIVDEQGSVLVLDSGNKRVLLLDSNLEIEREFITDLRGTVKICLLKAPYSLYVVVRSVKADNVLVFNIK